MGGAEGTGRLWEQFSIATSSLLAIMGLEPMSMRGQNPSAMVRVFCRKNRICVSCFRRWTERGTTHCAKCNRARARSQKSRLRRNYERDVKAGVCVRCHKRSATPTNKRCQKCQDRHANQKRLSK